MAHGFGHSYLQMTLRYIGNGASTDSYDVAKQGSSRFEFYHIGLVSKQRSGNQWSASSPSFKRFKSSKHQLIEGGGLDFDSS